MWVVFASIMLAFFVFCCISSCISLKGKNNIDFYSSTLLRHMQVPSNISGPKPFSYTQAPIQVTNVAVNPPMAAPKSPSSYPPPNQPTWAPPSAAPVAPKPAGPVQGVY